MFKVREIVHDDAVELGNHELSLLFPDRAAAVAYVHSLQVHFERYGRDEEHGYWWAHDEQMGTDVLPVLSPAIG